MLSEVLAWGSKKFLYKRGGGWDGFILVGMLDANLEGFAVVWLWAPRGKISRFLKLRIGSKKNVTQHITSIGRKYTESNEQTIKQKRK